MSQPPSGNEVLDNQTVEEVREILSVLQSSEDVDKLKSQYKILFNFLKSKNDTRDASKYIAANLWKLIKVIERDLKSTAVMYEAFMCYGYLSYHNVYAKAFTKNQIDRYFQTMIDSGNASRKTCSLSIWCIGIQAFKNKEVLQKYEDRIFGLIEKGFINFENSTTLVRENLTTVSKMIFMLDAKKYSVKWFPHVIRNALRVNVEQVFISANEILERIDLTAQNRRTSTGISKFIESSNDLRTAVCEKIASCKIFKRKKIHELSSVVKVRLLRTLGKVIEICKNELYSSRNVRIAEKVYTLFMQCSRESVGNDDRTRLECWKNLQLFLKYRYSKADEARINQSKSLANLVKVLAYRYRKEPDHNVKLWIVSGWSHLISSLIDRTGKIYSLVIGGVLNVISSKKNEEIHSNVLVLLANLVFFRKKSPVATQFGFDQHAHFDDFSSPLHGILHFLLGNIQLYSEDKGAGLLNSQIDLLRSILKRISILEDGKESKHFEKINTFVKQLMLTKLDRSTKLILLKAIHEESPLQFFQNIFIEISNELVKDEVFVDDDSASIFMKDFHFLLFSNISKSHYCFKIILLNAYKNESFEVFFYVWKMLAEMVVINLSKMRKNGSAGKDPLEDAVFQVVFGILDKMGSMENIGDGGIDYVGIYTQICTQILVKYRKEKFCVRFTEIIRSVPKISVIWLIYTLKLISVTSAVYSRICRTTVVEILNEFVTKISSSCVGENFDNHEEFLSFVQSSIQMYCEVFNSLGTSWRDDSLVLLDKVFLFLFDFVENGEKYDKIKEEVAKLWKFALEKLKLSNPPIRDQQFLMGIEKVLCKSFNSKFAKIQNISISFWNRAYSNLTEKVDYPNSLLVILTRLSAEGRIFLPTFDPEGRRKRKREKEFTEDGYLVVDNTQRPNNGIPNLTETQEEREREKKRRKVHIEDFNPSLQETPNFESESYNHQQQQLKMRNETLAKKFEDRKPVKAVDIGLEMTLKLEESDEDIDGEVDEEEEEIIYEPKRIIQASPEIIIEDDDDDDEIMLDKTVKNEDQDDVMDTSDEKMGQYIDAGDNRKDNNNSHLKITQQSDDLNELSDVIFPRINTQLRTIHEDIGNNQWKNEELCTFQGNVTGILQTINQKMMSNSASGRSNFQ